MLSHVLKCPQIASYYHPAPVSSTLKLPKCPPCFQLDCATSRNLNLHIYITHAFPRMQMFAAFIIRLLLRRQTICCAKKHLSYLTHDFLIKGTPGAVLTAMYVNSSQDCSEFHEIIV